MANDASDPSETSVTAERDDNDADLVLIASFATVMEAQLAQSRLEGEGIESFTSNEGAVGVMPFLGNALGGVRLYVAPNDEATAREILEVTVGPTKLE